MADKTLTAQQRRIIDYINSFGGITTLQAYNDLGITSLPKRMSELKRMGYKIDKKFIPVRNRFGERVSVVFYSFAEVPSNDVSQS